MAIVVNTLEDARAAMREGITGFSTPPYGACYAGLGYYQAMIAQLREEFPSIQFTLTLDCGDDPALAYEAMSAGFTHVACGCDATRFESLEAHAKSRQVRVIRPSHTNWHDAC